MLQSSGARLLLRTTSSSSSLSSRAVFASPTLRCLHSSRIPRTTHALHSAVHAEQAGAEGARSGNKKRFAAAAAGAVAFAGLGAAFLNSDSSDSQALLSPSVNPNDPLSALDPTVLAKTSAHLTSAALSDLVRQWVVYAVSEQSLLVSAAPWIVEKLQWANDNVPLIGPAVWTVFAFVSLLDLLVLARGSRKLTHALSSANRAWRIPSIACSWAARLSQAAPRP